MDVLYEEYDCHVQIIHFADSLKEYCHELGWNGKKDNNGRVLLQFVGTEWGRECINEDIWVKKVEEKIHECDYVIFPDTRFKNEIEYFSNYEQNTFKVVRHNLDGSEWDNRLNDSQNRHGSETALDDYYFDYYIHAYSGKIEMLEKDAEMIAAKLEG
ncbi:MAG: hypothetical protein K9K32_06740 [Halanaerobiales bacterium]|nr:hypothetical protein [Halanaerobiales bacterium]